jgi:putative transposase
MPHYRRVRIAGGTYFFTVVLHDRSSSLLVRHMTALRRAFSETKRSRPFEIIAITVLPDHLHCVWTLPAGDTDNATRWRQIKAGFTRSLPRTDSAVASRSARRERDVWQRRFWERSLIDEVDLAAHVAYTHRNPQKHGLVTRVCEWPYSSFHRYVREGHLPQDWCDP